MKKLTLLILLSFAVSAWATPIQLDSTRRTATLDQPTTTALVALVGQPSGNWAGVDIPAGLSIAQLSKFGIVPDAQGATVQLHFNNGWQRAYRVSSAAVADLFAVLVPSAGSWPGITITGGKQLSQAKVLIVTVTGATSTAFYIFQ